MPEIEAWKLRKALDRVQRDATVAAQIEAGAATERCGGGCGRVTVCPVVCIVNTENAKEVKSGGVPLTEANGVKGVTGFWRGIPVCDECHRAPNGTLKGHYFAVEDADAAMHRAGSQGVAA